MHVKILLFHNMELVSKYLISYNYNTINSTVIAE